MHSSPRTTKGSRTREKLLGAAVELIPQMGWTAVTARQLAQKAGVLPGVVHYHFNSVDALLAEAAVRTMHEALEAPVQLLESADTPAEGLRKLLGALDGSAPESHMNLLFTEVFLAAARSPELAASLRDVLDGFRSRTAGWLVQTGYPGDPHAAAAVLAAAIDGLMLHRGLDPDLTSAVTAPVLAAMLTNPPATQTSPEGEHR